MAEYNEVYDKLVESDVDFMGLIAYGLYKRGKRKHIIDFIEQKHRRPTNKEINAYVDMALGQLDMYKTQADQVFLKVVGEAVRKELERTHEHQKLVEVVVKEAKGELSKVEVNYQEAVEQSLKNHTKEIKEELNKVTKNCQVVEESVKKHTFSFWGTVGVNMVSAVLLPIIAFVVLLIICALYPNFPDMAKEMIKSFSI